VYKLAEEQMHINILTWHNLIDIIELYAPNADLNKLVIQVKMPNGWHYLTTDF
jgi:hypothetical protein